MQSVGAPTASRPFGEFPLRKASAHGLGHFLSSYDADHAPVHIPPPCVALDGRRQLLKKGFPPRGSASGGASQEVRQVSNIGSNAPRLVAGEELATARSPGSSSKDVGERLPVVVPGSRRPSPRRTLSVLVADWSVLNKRRRSIWRNGCRRKLDGPRARHRRRCRAPMMTGGCAGVMSGAIRPTGSGAGGSGRASIGARGQRLHHRRPAAATCGARASRYRDRRRPWRNHRGR
jgi:hypothetical protein